MLPSDIAADDPELLELIEHLKKATYSIAEVVAIGPAKATKIFEEIAAGRLRAGYCGSRRFITAVDLARWLLMLRREGEANATAAARGEQARERQLAPEVQRRRRERRTAGLRRARRKRREIPADETPAQT